MKEFKDLTEKEKEELRDKFARQDLENADYDFLYDLALQKRQEDYKDENSLKETYDFHKEMEEESKE